MRGYWKRNPDKYAAFLAHQKKRRKETGLGRKRHERILANPVLHEKAKAAQRASYERRKHIVRDRQGGATYGITPEEYAARVAKPCEICGVLEPRGKRGCGMHVDHDHRTGRLRGTLCHRCNRGIGMFDDDPEKMRRAVEYVLTWRGD